MPYTAFCVSIFCVQLTFANLKIYINSNDIHSLQQFSSAISQFNFAPKFPSCDIQVPTNIQLTVPHPRGIQENPASSCEPSFLHLHILLISCVALEHGPVSFISGRLRQGLKIPAIPLQKSTHLLICSSAHLLQEGNLHEQ
jgi:hypothetical protein